MQMRRCLMCGSGNIVLWLGGAIGTLYHCPECSYVGPVVIEAAGWDNPKPSSGVWCARKPESLDSARPNYKIMNEEVRRTGKSRLWDFFSIS